MPTMIALPDGETRLELVESRDGYYSAMACQQGGSTRWRVEPPDGASDAWVGVTLEDGTIVANSWSGWRCEIDPETGEETARSFTK